MAFGKAIFHQKKGSGHGLSISMFVAGRVSSLWCIQSIVFFQQGKDAKTKKPKQRSHGATAVQQGGKGLRFFKAVPHA